MLQWIPAVLALIAAGTALVATILGPYFSRKSAREQIESSTSIAENQIKATVSIADKQIKATVISTNRQAWINELRNLIAEFLSLLAIISTSIVEESAHFGKRWLIYEKIKLLLNSMEEDHIELLKLLFEVNNLVGKLPSEGKPEEVIRPKFNEIIKKSLLISALSQSVLKREWERVKQGD